MKILVATQNEHKVRELSGFLGECPWRKIGPLWNVEETGATLIDNALLKARAARLLAAADEIVIAEDTGLFVEALGGAPGVYSARYAGEGCSFEDNIQKLLSTMAHVAEGNRQAFFMTVLVAIFSDGSTLVSCGRLNGMIVQDPRGAQGFGYDPVFLVEEKAKTLAELSLEEKNLLSHRAKAASAALPYLLTPAKTPVKC